MCGIAGYWAPKGQQDADLLARMSKGVAHRGPDGEGQWFWPENNASAPHLAFGHRRFALLDQSHAASQPMHRSVFTLIFNGEIYNHAALRQQLTELGSSFHSRSDTEVLLEAWRVWGKDCLPKLRGFFAFALFDAQAQELWLVRDALGKAPLYFIQHDDFLCFASDIKPLLEACPQEKAKLRNTAITDYLHFGRRDFAHHTFWENINSLPAGSWLKIQLPSGQTSAQHWWQMPAQRWTSDDLSMAEAVKGLQTLLHEAVDLRMNSDRKTGFTLSGGMDSSALLAIACQHLPAGEKLPVLTIGYKDKAQDETYFAKLLTRKYAHQTEHIVLDGLDQTVLEEWDHFLGLQEEPFHDPVLYTDYLQQKQLKALGADICITGAGGDELLAGYPSFFPSHIRGLWQEGGLLQTPEILRDLFMLARSFSAQEWLNLWAKKSSDSTQLLGSQSLAQNLSPDLHTQIMQKMGNYQMNYWLRSLQKTYMSIPIEPRLPLLDQNLVEYAMRLPLNYLIHCGWPKYVLRKAVEPLLPREVVWRHKKMGFPFDTGKWLLQQESALQGILHSARENPWVNIPYARQHYHKIALANPQLLWRVLCFVSWWEKLQSNQLFTGPKK